MKFSVLFFGALLATNALAESPADNTNAPTRNHCIDVNMVRDRYVLDERRVLVWTRTTPYLLVLGRPISALTKGHNSISLMDGNHDGEICASLNDGIYLEDTLMPRATNIVRLLRLNDAQVRSLEHAFNRSLQRRPRGIWKSKPEAAPTE
jgi:hypothetical protein